MTPTDAAFEAGVESWSASTGARQVESTFLRVLEAIEDPSPETLRLLGGVWSGELVVGSDPVDVKSAAGRILEPWESAATSAMGGVNRSNTASKLQKTRRLLANSA